MNKSLAGILGVTVALTLLAGCTAYDRTKDQFTQPVVKDVKKGMSRQQVMQIAGKPSTEVTMVHARGTARPISSVNEMVKLKPTCGPRRNGSRHELRLPDLRRV
ncbi:osmotically inducible lipoprotein E [Klebsiella pneumoniae]|uniref:Osmotically inducible lipoprotein E n=1 Tax=Klebsiella pneumoniae TaxID=573 RepID=A0A2X3F0M7_KLEPN|nr:osmotically inducible lipoprotein E [Klebsiella pneumoniae]